MGSLTSVNDFAHFKEFFILFISVITKLNAKLLTRSNSSRCNTCSDFVGGGGFGMCNSGNTCNSYIPTEAVQAWGNTANKW